MVLIKRLKSTLPYVSILVLFWAAISFCAKAQADNGYVRINWESLELSSQQRDTLNTLDQQWKTVVCKLAPRIRMNEEKLRELMNSDSPDEDQIIKLQEQIHQDKATLKVDATEIFLSKRKALNKEQQQKLREMLNMY